MSKPIGTVHLEVKKGTSSTGEEQWQDVGPISLLDQPQEASLSSVPAAAQVLNPPSRQQLPKAAKKFLLSGTPKQERKSVYLYRHAPAHQPNTNLLVLLHGAGDTHVSFDRLGQTMALPQTATLSWNAKHFVQLPLGLGCTWFHEINYNTGEPLSLDSRERIESLQEATRKMIQLVELLLEGWVAERIFLLGYGAGATLAMSTCHEWCRESRPALGGAICVAGGLMNGAETSREPFVVDSKSAATPVLLLVGSNNTSFTPTMAKQAKQAYGNDKVQVHVEPNKGQGMISTKSEMQVVMKFLSQRLVRATTAFPGATNAPS